MIVEFEAFLKMKGVGPRSLSRELERIGWTRRQIIDKSVGRVPLTDVDRRALTAYALGLPPFTPEVATLIGNGFSLQGQNPVTLQAGGDDA